jgi:RNA polymerase sigma factor (sigma-70 family)
MDKRSDSAAPIGTAAPAPPVTGTPDPAAAGEIYLTLAPLLRRVAIRKFRIPPADAEGLVHDVFNNSLMSTRVVRTDLRAYLIGAICNASRNYWRSRRSEDRLFVEDDPAMTGAVTDDLFDGLAVHLVVASTLARLGDRCREALRRYYLDGEETGTIAEAMNTSPSNVNYLMHVCRKRARDAYEQLTRGR